MPDLRIHLFQRFNVAYNASEVEGWGSQKAQELMCYLLLFRDRAHHREVLASQLWEQGSSSTVKKNLRQVLWQVNSALLHTNQSPGIEILLIDSDWIQVNVKADYWLDVAEFERAYHSVTGKKGFELSQSEVKRLATAVQLYRGHLLEGWYHGWCVYERERLHNIYLVMLDKLLGFSAEGQHYDAGLYFGALALRSDPARERTHRRLMRLHYLSGHRSSALRQYEVCCAALRDELGVEPTYTTKRLYEDICQERTDAVAFHRFISPRAEKANEDVATQIRRLQTTIDCVQDQLTQLKRTLPP